MQRCVATILTMVLSLCFTSQANAAPSPRNSAFSYQGQLKQSGGPANGSFDFAFTVFDQPEEGESLGEAQLHEEVSVSQGLFSVELDFGNVIFNERALWIEVGVRSSAAAGELTILSPRQPLHLIARNGEEAPLSAPLTGTVTVGAGSTTVIGSDTAFTDELKIGDAILIEQELFSVVELEDDFQLQINQPHSMGALNAQAFADGQLLEVQNGIGERQFAVERAGIVIGTDGTPITRIEHGTLGVCDDGVVNTLSGTTSFQIPFRTPPRLFLTPNRAAAATCTEVLLEFVNQSSFNWLALNGVAGIVSPCDCIYWMAIGST